LAHHRPVSPTPAYETLRRASNFLAALPSTLGKSASARSEFVLPPRVLGNGLRELDRFLDHLIIETGRNAGINAAAGGRRSEQRLRHLRQELCIDHPDQDRLRALERSRVCLYHYQGIVQRGDGPRVDVMTSGWHTGIPGASPLRQVRLGQILAISADDLTEVCAWYRRLAATLLDRPGN